MSNNQATYFASFGYAILAYFHGSFLYLWVFVWGNPYRYGFIQNVLDVWSNLHLHFFVPYYFTNFTISFTMCLVVLFSKRWHNAPFKTLFVVSWVLALIMVFKMVHLIEAAPYLIAPFFLSVRLFNSSQINSAYFAWTESVKNMKSTKKILTLVEKSKTRTGQALSWVLYLAVLASVTVIVVKEVEKERAGHIYFYNLNAVAKNAFDNGDFVNAKAYAIELETLTPKYDDHRFYGEAVQDSNIVLGSIALKEGRVEDAKNHLLAAGMSPGSPRMRVWGPDMSLAKDLLEQGEKETVLEYLKLCKSFWEFDDGHLDEWINLVQAGKVPNFDENLRY